MTPQIPYAPVMDLFTPPEWQALHLLRARYQQDCDLFTARERAHLHFLRWLYQTGGLVP